MQPDIPSLPRHERAWRHFLTHLDTAWARSARRLRWGGAMAGALCAAGLTHLLVEAWQVVAVAGYAGGHYGKHWARGLTEKIQERLHKLVQFRPLDGDEPLDSWLYVEIDRILAYRPEWLNEVASWAFQNNNILYTRHLWTLRERLGRTPPEQFEIISLPPVENAPYDPGMYDEVAWEDIAQGELKSAIDALGLQKHTSSAVAMGALRRI